MDQEKNGMSAQEMCETEKENAAGGIHNSPFTRKEHEAYLKKKWRTEHIFSFVLCGICTLALFAMLPELLNIKPAVLWCFLPIAVFVEYGVFNNKMMAYVEKNLYDGNTAFADGRREK